MIDFMNYEVLHLPCCREHFLSMIMVCGLLPRTTGALWGSVIGSWLPRGHTNVHLATLLSFSDMVCSQAPRDLKNNPSVIFLPEQSANIILWNYNPNSSSLVTVIASEARKGCSPFAKPHSHALQRECIYDINKKHTRTQKVVVVQQ